MNSSNHLTNPIQFNGALLKVASRCNLNCDYCYVYNHVDQSWREQPKFMKEETVHKFSERLRDYVTTNNIPNFSITFHGGEPLLYSANGLARLTEIVKNVVGNSTELDFSLQTNGVLLDEASLDVLERSNISISMSLDGPQYANDLHRLDYNGQSTFNETVRALNLLNTKSENVFKGVISVIDPKVPPQDVFDFFYPFNLPRLDLLLPDATYISPPIGREQNHQTYITWLLEAFDLWFHKYSDLPLRFFDALLGTRVGIPSPTDALGFGSVSLLVVETNGEYTDHDVFKITESGANRLGYTVEDADFEDVANHQKVLEHNYKISYLGVASECKSCPALEACGGGSLMHRYHPNRGLDAPTVYCREMFHLVEKATSLLKDGLLKTSEASSYSTEMPHFSLLSFDPNLVEECKFWKRETNELTTELANKIGLDIHGDISAASVLLYSNNSNSSLTPPNSNNVSTELWLNRIQVHSCEPWLIIPFQDSIRFVSKDSCKFKYGSEILNLVELYLSTLSPSIPLAIGELISDLVFVESTVDYETGIFSFSDDSAPNVIYLDPYVGDNSLGPDDIADSILHEFLHHVLYHIELATPLLYNYDSPRFPAPWRNGLRPAGGFLHGTFVFSGLSLYWKAIANSKVDLPMLNRDKAKMNAEKFLHQAIYGIQSSNQFALLTPAGVQLLQNISNQIGVSIKPLQPPGLLSKSLP